MIRIKNDDYYIVNIKSADQQPFFWNYKIYRSASLICFYIYQIFQSIVIYNIGRITINILI